MTMRAVVPSSEAQELFRKVGALIVEYSKPSAAGPDAAVPLAIVAQVLGCCVAAAAGPHVALETVIRNFSAALNQKTEIAMIGIFGPDEFPPAPEVPNAPSTTTEQ